MLACSHRRTVLTLTGGSYRMRCHRDAINALRPALTGRSEGGEISPSHLGNSRILDSTFTRRDV